MEIDYISDIIDNEDTILVIKWRLDKPEQLLYIDNMLNYISKYNP
jgi:hypothetical protein